MPVPTPTLTVGTGADQIARALCPDAPGGSRPVRDWTARRRANGWTPSAVDLQSLDHLEQETP